MSTAVQILAWVYLITSPALLLIAAIEIVPVLLDDRRAAREKAKADRALERAQKRLSAEEFRRRWASRFGEYECVGGPLDGLVRSCRREGVLPTIGGYYVVHTVDARMHFHAKAAVSSSWMDGL